MHENSNIAEALAATGRRHVSLASKEASASNRLVVLAGQHCLVSLKAGGGLSVRRQCGHRIGVTRVASRRAMMALHTADRLGDGGGLILRRLGGHL